MKCIAILCLLLAAIAASDTSHAESFRNPIRIATSVDPYSVSVSDLNGDGLLDIVWTRFGTLTTDPATVHTLLAQAGGGYAVGPVLSLPANVTAFCRMADVNRDGKPDVICPYANLFDAALLTFPGNGDGSFGAPVTTALPSSEDNEVYWGPLLHMLTDLNGDGIPDAVIFDAEAGTGYVMLSQGDGSFKLASTIYGSGPPQAMDINGDGFIDLLFPYPGSILLGNGKGKFTAVSSGIPVAGSCVFGKVDGDTAIDAVCGAQLATDGDIIGGTQLTIFHGNGDGTFNPTSIKTVTYGDHSNEYNGFGTFQVPMAVLDLNGDGIPDILGEAGDGLTVLLGQPGLNFAYPTHYATGYTPFFGGDVGEFSVQIADLNGDGLPDLVSTGPNSVYVVYGRRDGVYDTARAYEVTQEIGYETVADYNEDGIPDIAATGDQAIELSLGNGDGTFQYRVPLPRGDIDFSTPLSATNAHIIHGDFNGDGHKDLIAIGSSGIYQYDDYILFGNGDGTFTTPALVANTSQLFPDGDWSTVFDVNRDGRDDILTSDDGHLYFALSHGDGSFTTVTTTIPTDVSPTYGQVQTLPALADFNGDGKADAIYGTGTSVHILKGNGDGSFASTGATLSIPPYLGVPTAGASAVAAGDFDGDGNQDIALVAYAGNTLATPADQFRSVLLVSYGDGKGGFSALTPVTGFDRVYTNVNAADLNKDGLADLVFKTSGSLGSGYAVGVVNSLPGRNFGPEVNYYAGTGLADLAIVDLNNDGFPDLVFGNGDYNIRASSVTVLMNLGNTVEVTGLLRANPEPSVAGQPFQLIAGLTAPDNSTLSGDISFSIDDAVVGTAPLASNIANLTVSKLLSAGVHSLSATWPGNSTYPPVTLAGTHEVAAGYPTSTSITSNYNPAPYHTPVTFTMAVQSTSGTPTGSVSIADGATTLATIPLSGGGATFITAGLTSGTHIMQAVFNPDPGWASSTGNLTEQIDKTGTTNDLIVIPNPVYAWQAISVQASVVGSGQTPTGTVTLAEDLSPTTTQALVDGTTTFHVSFSSAGDHILGGAYSGDQNYNQGGFPLVSETVLINPTATHLKVATDPAIAYQSVTLQASVSSNTSPKPFPSGIVSFRDGTSPLGTASLVDGSATLTTSNLNAGVHTLSADYSGDPAFSSSNSTHLSLTVQRAPVSAHLTSSDNPSYLGSSVTLTAKALASRVPTGTFTFLDGATHLGGPVSLDAQGSAVYATQALADGAHAITASYSGDADFLPATSSVLDQIVVPPGDFILTASPVSASFYTGESKSFLLNITPTGGFNRPLGFTCSGLPAASTCTFTPSSIVSGQGQTSVLIQTSAPHRSSTAVRTGSGAVLAAALGLLVFPKRRRALGNSLLSLCLLGIACACIGCGNSRTLSGGTTPGNYTVTFTATTSSLPALSHAATVNIVVKSLF